MPPICLFTKCLVKMFHKNVWSKRFIKMSHSVLYVLSTNIHQFILFVLSLLSIISVFSSIIHHPTIINVHFLYFLYFLSSSIIHHPSMYTFWTKKVHNGFLKNVKNGQKQSKTGFLKKLKIINNGQKMSQTVKPIKMV